MNEFKVGEYLVINENVINNNRASAKWIGVIIQVTGNQSDLEHLARCEYTHPDGGKKRVGYFGKFYLQKATEAEVLTAKLLGLI